MSGKTAVTDDRPDPADRDQLTTTFVELAIRIGVLGLVLYWTFVLVQPFVTIVIWSAVLTVALYPAFDWMVPRLGGRRRLAAALITIVSLLVVIGPATWLALDLVESLRMISERFDLSTLAIPAPPAAVKEWPLIGGPIYQFWDLASTNLKEALARIVPQLKPVGATLLGIAADAGIGILKFFVAIIVAGFLFAPAPSIVDAVKRFLRRLVPDRGEEFANLAGATIRAVSRGVVGISVLQAMLAGIGLVIAGVPASSLITSAVLICGIIQIGPAIILVPVVIWSWFAMEPGTALLFTAYMIPVNLLDNILKPLVMGRGLKTPMLVILIGVLGGTLAYGITGLFLGPIILAVIWELLVAWIRARNPA
jgi:predicted PurR-regulated permease PerM